MKPVFIKNLNYKVTYNFSNIEESISNQILKVISLGEYSQSIEMSVSDSYPLDGENYHFGDINVIGRDAEKYIDSIVEGVFGITLDQE